MKKWTSLAVGIVMVVALAVPAFAAEGDTAGDGQDVARMVLHRHELSLKVGSKTGTLDGNNITVDPIVVRNGSTYFSLKTIERVGAGIVKWDVQQRRAAIVMHSAIIPNSNITFRPGKPYVYFGDNPAEFLKIPAPFLSDGRVYIPVSALRWVGISSEWKTGTLKWRWSEKAIELMQPKLSTANTEISFTVLYEKDIKTPYLMLPFGAGAWASYNGSIVARDIETGGKLFNRVRFKLSLTPGITPIELTANAFAKERFEIIRTSETPSSIQITEEGQEYGVTFTKPDDGFLKITPGGSIPIAGNISQQRNGFDDLMISIQQYNKYEYTEVHTVKVPIKEAAFAGSIAIKGKGEYWIKVYSPPYIPSTEQGALRTEWASFRVKIE
ncbi:hypothetical protein SD71_00080 [Cohnella kolymensis]|uniref:Copper amine oxidase-like N-terminal domain-containing protein n=1 Tax=Cohnella kolymensis TaxID=1590652 RepID=A0ABR5A9V2_9BACL|nr:stalk domain-containing protein [Cohnella kolymensis]KIL37182.1 hypothetical protein SD71_00080 [Cohnella kolymensis]